MSKPYIPKVTVTLRREFDGKVERELTVSVYGGTGRALECAVDGAMSLAMQTRTSESEEAP